jgi:cardiolipin synthase A/B
VYLTVAYFAPDPQLRKALIDAASRGVDGVWSTVGSTNLDWRSFLHNDEINAVVLGRGFAVQMEVMFANGMAQSDAIVPNQWRRRPLLQRLTEQFARIGAYWL